MELSQSAPRAIPTTHTPDAFNWLMVTVITLFAAGGFVDGWAHMHGRVDNTFFTPWHGILYGAYLITTLTLFGYTTYKLIRTKSRIREAIPQGYTYSIIGILLFAVGGIADFAWHSAFGFEKSVEANFSPSHFVLQIAVILIESGPLLALWTKPTDKTKPELLHLFPALLSAALMLSGITGFTMWANPFAATWPAAPYAAPLNTPLGFFPIALSGASILLYSITIVPGNPGALPIQGTPIGSLTIILTINIIAESVYYDQQRLIPMAVITGLCLDMICTRLQPWHGNQLSLCILGFLTPAILFTLYFITLQLTDHIWVSTDIWAGTILLAATSGLAAAFVVGNRFHTTSIS